MFCGPSYARGRDGCLLGGGPCLHDASGTMTPQEAHNDFFELLASGGIVGAAIGICFP